MIHLTVSAPVRTPQRPRDLVNQHAHAHTHGGTHAVEHTHTQNPRASQGRTGRVALPAGSVPSAAGTAGVCGQGWRDGHRAPARAHLGEPVASQSLFSR